MTDKAHEDTERFFNQQLMPLATRLKAQGVALLDPGPDAGAASYYLPRTQRRMRREDFECGGLSTPQHAQAEMAAMWRQADRHPLAPLAAGVAQLACSLRKGQAQSSDVSAFVYAMY